jgi:hypothetical protein
LADKRKLSIVWPINGQSEEKQVKNGSAGILKFETFGATRSVGSLALA